MKGKTKMWMNEWLMTWVTRTCRNDQGDSLLGRHVRWLDDEVDEWTEMVSGRVSVCLAGRVMGRTVLRMGGRAGGWMLE